MISVEEKKRFIVKHYLEQKQLPPAEQLGSEEAVNKLYSEITPQEPTQQSITKYKVRIIQDHDKEARKRTVQDFVNYFNARYKAIASILQGRQELRNITSISRVLQKQDNETVSIIGIVSDKQLTKNDNYIITLEDQSGQMKVIVSKKKQDAHLVARDIVVDEVIGVTGSPGTNVLFANSVTIPDVPRATELKKSPDEAYAVVLSCVHVGSSLFLEEEFLRFINWLRGKVGDERQKEIASKVKYIFVCGDIVDGIGIYPKQEEELDIQDIYEQYNEAARLFSQIPEDKAVIMCPGNHDAMRISEPQPKLPKDFAKAMWEVPNVILVSNPAMVNIHESEDFPGFNVLMYHGYSFDYYGDNVEGVKEGRHISDRVGPIMKFLLQRRHLAPSHKSTLYIPDPDEDPLVIQQVPDIYLAGHIHKAAVENYRGVIIAAGSCFQAKTDFQEKVGHEPEPSRVPLINLQSREVKMLRFDQ